MTTFRSWRSYWDFERSVRRDLRYTHSAETHEFLDAVTETAPSRTVTLEEGAVFWWAQLGHGWRDEHQGDDTFEIECAHPPERMRPFRDRATEGRANARGIPCLYLATTKEAAMSEVRPWIGSYISVAQFKLPSALEIINCTRDHARTPVYFEEPSPEEVEKTVWSYIDRSFATPMTRSDDTADYAATQIIAELFKKAGFDGVAYKSSFGENGYNVALFNIDAAELINCSLYRVDSIEMKFSEQDNPYFVRKHHEKEASR